jgi:hypothetical protein
MYGLDKRQGICFTCRTIIKFHKHYKTWNAEAILDAIGVSDPTYGGCQDRTPEVIQPAPLSQRARDYIRSRGISQKTLLHFPVLHEVEHWGKKWLCWQNVAGSYELREIFGAEWAMPRGSTKTYSRFDLRPGKTMVVCEGLFSMLSYAQLHDYVPDTYVVLNSVTTIPHLIRDALSWGMEQMILALDFDKAGLDGNRDLYLAFSPTMEVKVHHPPISGKDWNDMLMEKQ